MAPRASSRPYGRDQVVAAVIGAATALFAQRGPAAVSLRDVAQAADVNLGLIHRHIGSKTDLLTAVLRARPGMPPVGTETIDEVVTGLIARDSEPPPYTAILVRAALDGYDLAELEVDYPIVHSAMAQLRDRLAPVDADLRAALAAAMVLGWHALGRELLDVVGRADTSADELVRSLEPAIVALLSTKS